MTFKVPFIPNHSDSFSAVLQAAKGKDLPSPKLPTSIMVSAYSGNTEAKHFCQTLTAQGKCIFLRRISWEEVLRASPSQPCRMLAFMRKDVLQWLHYIGHVLLPDTVRPSPFTGQKFPALLIVWYFPVQCRVLGPRPPQKHCH